MMREREKNDRVKCAVLNDLKVGMGKVTPKITGYEPKETYSTDSLSVRKIIQNARNLL